jgi:subtilisin family serine protease/chitodextrinase
MKKGVSAIIVCFFLVSLITLECAVAKPVEKIDVIVGFKGRPNVELLQAHGGEIKHSYKIITAVACSLPQKAIKALEKNPTIAYIDMDYEVSILETPNDPRLSELWGLDNTGQTGGTNDADIDALEAWDIQTGSSGIVIAVIDTGVEYSHVDLSGNMWTNPGETASNGVDDDGNGYVDDVYGWDFYNNDNNPMDDHSHGTHCAGTIAAMGNNGIGVVGVNWEAKVMALKFLSASGSGDTSDAVAAIEYATMMKREYEIPVIALSNSWGGGGFSQALEDSITAANSEGILFVAAAGNNYGSNNDVVPYYPAGYDVPNVMSVAATDHNDYLASFSNFGASTVDLGAPGVNILSTVLNNGYGTKSGTSMATPHVSGVVGLIKAHFPGLTSSEIKARILGAVDPVSSLQGITVTGGRLNALNALEVDTVPPAPVDDLVTDSPTSSTVTLMWTATGDDGIVGAASSYDVRYSTLPVTDGNWGAATQAAGEPAPGLPGSYETFTVTGLSHGTTYYFALKVIDNVGNPSGLSNSVSETTITPTVIFLDDFESGVGGWTHSGIGDNWELGKPTSGPGYAISGSNAWATNLDGDYGLDYMLTYLVSPSIDLGGFTSAQLTFYHHYHTESYWDGGIVEVSPNGGITWVQITPQGGYPEDALSSYNTLGPVPAYSGYSGAAWHMAVFDISSYVGSSNVKIRFSFGSDYSVNWYPGWYIDHVKIQGDSAEPNTPPVADANGPYTGVEDIAVTFDGSGSYDPDDDPLTYSWDFGDSSTGNGVSPSHVYAAGGSYSVTLTVHDGKASSSDTTTAEIEHVNNPPVADAGADQTASDDDGNGYETVNLDGSNSDDPDGSITAYEWKEGDTVLGTDPILTSDFTDTGSPHTVTLTVTDNGGLTDTDTVEVTVLQNQAPVAEAGSDQSVFEGETVSFDGSSSHDNDGTINAYEWDFGDSSTGTDVTVIHSYSTAGTYTVILTVTDNGGLSSSDSTTITVNPAPTPSNTLHVGEITFTTESKGNRKWTRYRVTACVHVLDKNDHLVEGVEVFGYWSEPYTSAVQTIITNSDGIAMFQSNWVKNGGTFTFKVVDVAREGWGYDPLSSVTSDTITVP